MPDQITELRCPTCQKLLIGLSCDFDGEIGTRCRRCKMDVDFGHVPDVRLLCKCKKFLARGVVRAGSFRIHCERHRSIVVCGPSGILLAEKRPKPPRPVPPDIVGMIEARWRLRRYALARCSSEIAVGLRFDVFNRDGFRCRYCGRGPEQSVFLEADHQIPRSAGGEDSMANLVTACADCNRGKAAKPLTTLPT